MSDVGINELILLVGLLLVAGAGTYLTYFQQAEELDTLTTEVQTQRQELEQINALYDELAMAEVEAKQAYTTWQTRYKLIPATVTSPEIVRYLTDLTQEGFMSFDIQSAGVTNQDGYRFRTYRATGRAYFYHLYRFLWKLENNRAFYRVRNLRLQHMDMRETDDETGRTTMDVVVPFEMDIDVLHGGPKDLDNPPAALGLPEADRLPVAQTNNRPPVPQRVLPRAQPPLDPFYPLILKDLPPNEHGRMNIETARLISIVEGKAVFRTSDGVQRLGEGDRVYLGRIVEVDPARGRVVARLNRGGIADTIELQLPGENWLERARGPQEAEPAQQ